MKIQCNSNQNIYAILHRNKKNLKIHSKAPKIPNSQSNPEQKEQCWRINTRDFKFYYSIAIRKTAWSWHKIRQKDSNINSHNKSHEAFSKDACITHLQKDSIQTKGAGKTRCPYMEK